MELNPLFKSVICQDTAPVVICSVDHTVVFMNPASILRYKVDLTGKSIMECHNAKSCKKIEQVVEWFKESRENNRFFTMHYPKENKDIYMVALRNDSGELIGYYEKHESREPEAAKKIIDVTLKLTPEMAAISDENTHRSLVGHLGTHFDVMEKEFPLAYTKRKGIVFDASSVCGRDISLSDIDMTKVEPDMFVALYTGYIDKVPYGTRTYFGEHPQLSRELIHSLVDRGISIIGVDFAGIRRGAEHIPMDRYCAEHGVFVIENLCNLNCILEHGGRFTANTYPMSYAKITGLPCRVTMEV